MWKQKLGLGIQHLPGMTVTEEIRTLKKIGFEAFASWWKFKDVKVKKLKYERIRENYNPEF